MQISLLCNAGLALTHEGSTLLIDVLNGDVAPFCALKEEIWQRILNGQAPFENVVGLYFSHDHADHYDSKRAEAYLSQWQVPLFLPTLHSDHGELNMGSFEIRYGAIDHAPMDVATPPHVVSWIRAGGESIYIAADAKLDVDAHRKFLNGRCADVAFWNSMYLSRPETRMLMKEAAKNNYIYHMPEKNADSIGIWRKCERNFQRYGSELDTVTVLDRFPYQVK